MFRQESHRVVLLAASALLLTLVISKVLEDEEKVPPSGVVFEALLAETWLTEDGRLISVYSIRSSDGIDLELEVAGFDSPQEAKREFEKRLQHARQTVAIGLNTKAGQTVGQRAVVWFSDFGSLRHNRFLDWLSRKGFRRRAAILWTDGAYFRLVKSESLPHLMEFERQRAEFASKRGDN
jgi:hypothetical protein